MDVEIKKKSGDYNIVFQEGLSHYIARKVKIKNLKVKYCEKENIKIQNTKKVIEKCYVIQFSFSYME